MLQKSLLHAIKRQRSLRAKRVNLYFLTSDV
jgi:hypothetical protein